MREVLITELIDDFVNSVETNETFLNQTRKFNMLARVLGPLELEGLHEAWFYFGAPKDLVLYDAFGSTIDFLREQYKGMKTTV